MSGKVPRLIDPETIVGPDYKYLRTLLYVLFAVWITYLINEALTWEHPESYTLPLLLGPPFYILVVIQLLRIWDVLPIGLTTKIMEKTTSEEDPSGDMSLDFQEELDTDEGEAAEDSNAKTVLTLLGWLAMFPVTLYLVGFRVGFPLIVFVFAFYLTRTVTHALVLAVIVALIVQFLFLSLLGAPLWEGLIPEMLGL